MIDLLGDDVKEAPISEAKHKPTVKKGYASTPGSGPAGETCKTCKNAVRSGGCGQKSFSKCLLIKRHWTHGEGTDILLRSPACRHWAKDES